MLEKGLCIWAVGRPGLAATLDPDGLAASHPLWAADVARLGPFRRDKDLWRAQGTGDRPASMLVCGHCASSMDVAWALWDQGDLPPWAAVLALTQDAGRGQLRRPWASPAGNVHAAWAWPAQGPDRAGLTPLLAGLAAAEALDALGLDVAIKWPNDLLAGGRKVGGILVEERQGRTLVGMGLNLAQAPPDQDLRDDWAVPAGCLPVPAARRAGPASLWADLVFHAESCYQRQLSRAEPEAFIPALERRLAWKGMHVMVHGSGRPYAARITGLAPDGALLLDRDGRGESLYSGSISQLYTSSPHPPLARGGGLPHQRE